MDLHYFKYAHFARGIEFLSQLDNDRKTEKIYKIEDLHSLSNDISFCDKENEILSTSY